MGSGAVVGGGGASATASASAAGAPSSPGVVSGATAVADRLSVARAAGSGEVSVAGVVVSATELVVGSFSFVALGGVGGVGGVGVVAAWALTPGATMESPTTTANTPRR